MTKVMGSDQTTRQKANSRFYKLVYTKQPGLDNTILHERS
jgi:hypothetical protein